MLHIRNRGPAFHEEKLIFHVHECLHSQFLKCQCNTYVDWVENFKYLGLIIDDHLDWELNTTSIVKKLRSCVYVFHNLRNVLPLKVMKILYHSLVESAISYGLLTYGKKNEASLRRIGKLQNTIVKIMYYKNNRISKISEMYDKLKILRASQLFVYKIVLKYYSSNEFLIRRPESKTRQARKFIEHSSYNKFGERTLKCLLPEMFNKLPNDCTETTCKIGELKKNINNYLISYNDKDT